VYVKDPLSSIYKKFVLRREYHLTPGKVVPLLLCKTKWEPSKLYQILYGRSIPQVAEKFWGFGSCVLHSHLKLGPCSQNVLARDPYLTLHATFSIYNVGGWNFELAIKGRAIMRGNRNCQFVQFMAFFSRILFTILSERPRRAYPH
jgi:hypothetical protein